MRRQAPVVEWTIVENDADWERLCAPLLPDLRPAANRRLHQKYLCWCVAALIVLLAGIGGRWWRTAQDGLPQVAAQLNATRQLGHKVVTPSDSPVAAHVTNDQATQPRQHPFARQDAGLQGIQTADCDTQVDRSLYTVEFQGEQAVAHVITRTAPGALPYRQTYFYRCTAQGWLRTAAPDATLWGSERSLGTPSFVYYFRQNDATPVAAVLAQMDTLYQILRRNFGLSLAPIERKLVIKVSVTQPSGYAARWFDASDAISVPSPALYVAPVELTDAELLAQSIALPLLQYVLAQACERHAVGQSWQPLLDGLRLWQLWEMDLPLAIWREDVVRWVYADLPTTRPGQAVVLPERYTALCMEHKLWMPSPTEINIPLLCAELAWEDLLVSPWGRYDQLTHMDQLVIPLRPGEYMEEPDSLRLVRHPGHTVALATLVEYAVVTYGLERLPVLVASLGQYESWETLLPAVYGVSSVEFEAGWQRYLAAQYGVGFGIRCLARLA